MIENFLEANRIDEDPEDWFFSDEGIELKAKRLTDYVLEYHKERSRQPVEKMFTRLYHRGKEEYDRTPKIEFTSDFDEELENLYGPHSRKFTDNE